MTEIDKQKYERLVKEIADLKAKVKKKDKEIQEWQEAASLAAE